MLCLALRALLGPATVAKTVRHALDGSYLFIHHPLDLSVTGRHRRPSLVVPFISALAVTTGHNLSWAHAARWKQSHAVIFKGAGILYEKPQLDVFFICLMQGYLQHMVFLPCITGFQCLYVHLRFSFFIIPAVIHQREQQKGQIHPFMLAFHFDISKDFCDASLDIISVC